MTTVIPTATRSKNRCSSADPVIGGVLIPGAAAPKLVSRDMIRRMKPGSVLVDVRSIRAAASNFTADHPCRSDLCRRWRGPLLRGQYAGRVARTSTFALNNATLPFGSLWRTRDGARPCRTSHLRQGLNVASGKVTCLEVANDLNYEYFPAQGVLAT